MTNSNLAKGAELAVGAELALFRREPGSFNLQKTFSKDQNKAIKLPLDLIGRAFPIFSSYNDS